MACRRERRRRNRIREMSGDIADGIQEWLGRFPGFTLAVDGRSVQFLNGKKFWVWDLSSLNSFVAGGTYRRFAAPGASVPISKPIDMDSSIQMVHVKVPALIA